MNPKKTYLLTGATGIVGSHILFELIHKSFTTNSIHKIILVVRNGSSLSAENRVKKILTAPNRPDFLKEYRLSAMMALLEIIPCDIHALSSNKLRESNAAPIHVIHCAGTTNLATSSIAEKETREEILDATKNIFEAIKECASHFTYISTAFSCGIQTAEVNDNFLNLKSHAYRNPYERCKNQSEHLVVALATKYHVQWQIVRPSIICGRLIDAPFFETPKFDVFYAWAIFLQKYSNRHREKFRIWIDRTAGLNIVPVDFVAKSIVYALDNPQLRELNIVNPKKVYHTQYISQVLAFFGVTGHDYVDAEPSDKEELETLYYKTVGELFKNYITIPDLMYETAQIQQVMTELKIDSDLKVEENFLNLISYAAEKNFATSY